MNDDTFQQVVSEYFQQPGAVDFAVPTGKDGEPLTPKGRELALILEEEKAWKEDSRYRAKRKLQDNFTWILDHQEESEDAEYAYHTLLRGYSKIVLSIIMKQQKSRTTHQNLTRSHYP